MQADKNSKVVTTTTTTTTEVVFVPLFHWTTIILLIVAGLLLILEIVAFINALLAKSIIGYIGAVKSVLSISLVVLVIVGVLRKSVSNLKLAFWLALPLFIIHFIFSIVFLIIFFIASSDKDENKPVTSTLLGVTLFDILLHALLPYAIRFHVRYLNPLVELPQPLFFWTSCSGAKKAFSGGSPS